MFIAFVIFNISGITLNIVVLFSLVLVLGIVVDDAIVVIENIQRHIHEYGRNARIAASTAMGEVTGAVIATALVLAAVFVPVALFPGTTGRLYQQFALTIAFSMLLSAFNANVYGTSRMAYSLAGRGDGPTALRRVWSAVRVSWALTNLLHRYPDTSAFDQRLQEVELDTLKRSPAAQAALAREYAGLPLEG